MKIIFELHYKGEKKGTCLLDSQNETVEFTYESKEAEKQVDWFIGGNTFYDFYELLNSRLGKFHKKSNLEEIIESLKLSKGRLNGDYWSILVN